MPYEHHEVVFIGHGEPELMIAAFSIGEFPLLFSQTILYKNGVRYMKLGDLDPDNAKRTDSSNSQGVN